MKLKRINKLVFVPIFFITTIVALIFFSQTQSCSGNRERKYLSSVIEYSYEYGVAPELVLAVIKAESNFKADAISEKGAVGLMQIMPSTASYIAQKVGYSCEIDLKNPDCNIALGCAYLSYLQTRFEDKDVCICAYNAGEGKVSKWLSDKKFSKNGKTLDKVGYSQTRYYLKKVLKYEKKYKEFLIKHNYYEAKE